MAENPELVSPQTPEVEDFDTTLSDADKASLTPEQIAVKRADFYKDLYKNARKGKTEVQKPIVEVKPQQVADESSRFDVMEEKVNMRLEGYTADQIREVEKYAKGANISLAEAKANPFVKAALDAQKSAQQAREATPEQTGRAVMVGSKSVDDILKDPTATPAQKQEAFEAKVAHMSRSK